MRGGNAAPEVPAKTPSGRGLQTTSTGEYSERATPRKPADDAAAMALLRAEHAHADLQALLANAVPLTGLASRYIGDLLALIELGLAVRRREAGLSQREAR